MDDVQVGEGNAATSATLPLTRTVGPLAPAATIAFATGDGSAVHPSDYVSATGTRTFRGTFLFA